MAKQKAHIRNAATLKLLAVQNTELANPSNRGFYTRNPRGHRRMHRPKKQECYWAGLGILYKFFRRAGINIAP